MADRLSRLRRLAAATAILERRARARLAAVEIERGRIADMRTALLAPSGADDRRLDDLVHAHRVRRLEDLDRRGALAEVAAARERAAAQRAAVVRTVADRRLAGAKTETRRAEEERRIEAVVDGMGPHRRRR